MASANVAVKDLTKAFETPSGRFMAVDGIDLVISPGEFVAIVGKSGSGKSTLLNLLSGIDRPTSGDLSVAGVRLGEMSEDELAQWRGRNLGVVFQFFQLLPTLTAVENVMLPMDLCKTYPAAQRRERALGLLGSLGIRDQADKLPGSLSGGQQQRVAIARALANDPKVLVADEPTGNVDAGTADVVLSAFQRLAREGKTIIMVTHEREAANWVDRVIHVQDGRVLADGPGAATVRPVPPLGG